MSVSLLKETINSFNQFLDVIEFKLVYVKSDNQFRLIDLQGANLGDIEGDTFDNIPSVFDRLNVYFEYGIINDIVEVLELENVPDKIEDLIEIVKKNDKTNSLDFDLKVLKMSIDMFSKESYNNNYILDNEMVLPLLNYLED